MGRGAYRVHATDGLCKVKQQYHQHVLLVVLLCVNIYIISG